MTASGGDEKARRGRAERLRRLIDKLKSGEEEPEPEPEEKERPESPREFVERTMREPEKEPEDE